MQIKGARAQNPPPGYCSSWTERIPSISERQTCIVLPPFPCVLHRCRPQTALIITLRPSVHPTSFIAHLSLGSRQRPVNHGTVALEEFSGAEGRSGLAFPCHDSSPDPIPRIAPRILTQVFLSGPSHSSPLLPWRTAQTGNLNFSPLITLV